MTCIEAESHVSELYDGEQVPAEAALHIEDCAHCRETLTAYSQIGAELRLMASRTEPASVVPDELLRKLRVQKRNWFHYLGGSLRIPRFALAALVIAMLVVVSATVTVVRAQNSRPLWFQFQLNPTAFGKDFSGTRVVKAGSEQRLGWTNSTQLNSAPTVIGANMMVKNIAEGHVELEIAAHNFGVIREVPISFGIQMEKIKLQPFTYTPGQPLTIPIDGGGTLTLNGEVVDHQTQFAWDQPLVPPADKLIIRSPVLLEGDKLLANEPGATAAASGSEVVAFNSPGIGTFAFSLKRLPGSIKAEANWGYITFSMNGKAYLLATAAPVCGGDQPRTVWVTFGPAFGKGVSLGGGPVTTFIHPN